MTHLTTVGEFGVHIGLVNLDEKGDLAEGLITRDGSVGSLVSVQSGPMNLRDMCCPSGKAESGGGSVERLSFRMS